MQRSLRRIKHRIKRLVTSYVSPLGWAVTGLAIASLIAFTILSWHELLTMAIVFACMMVAAIMLSLGNTSFTATIDVSSRRVTQIRRLARHGDQRGAPAIVVDFAQIAEIAYGLHAEHAIETGVASGCRESK